MIDGAEARINVAPGFDAEAAICVREANDQSDLQVTSIHKICFALPRHTSRVIHRLKCIVFQHLQLIIVCTNHTQQMHNLYTEIDSFQHALSSHKLTAVLCKSSHAHSPTLLPHKSTGILHKRHIGSARALPRARSPVRTSPQGSCTNKARGEGLPSKYRSHSKATVYHGLHKAASKNTTMGQCVQSSTQFR